MEFTIESLQDKIPASVYELLTAESYMDFPLPEEADIDVAYAFIAPLDFPYHWTPISQRTLTEEEIKAVKCCKITASKYGLSMQFILSKGGVKFIPCANCQLFEEGQQWNPMDLKLIELRKCDEDASIFRVVPAAQYVEIKEYPYMPHEEYKLRTEVSSEIIRRYNYLLRRDGKKVNIFKYLRPY